MGWYDPEVLAVYACLLVLVLFVLLIAMIVSALA